MTGLTEQMYDALNGKYPCRNGKEVVGKRGYKSGEVFKFKGVIKLNPAEFNKYFDGPKDFDFNHGASLERNDLEALVLLPEDAGQAVVKRVCYGYLSGGYLSGAGFFPPKYTEMALQSLVDAYSRRFADSGNIYEKSWLFDAVRRVIPGEMHRFAQFRDRIIAGIKNSHFYKEGDEWQYRKLNDAALDNIVFSTKKLGINHATDKEFISALWQISKEAPRGYLGSVAWEAFSEYILENNPEIVILFDIVRKKLVDRNLAQILSILPVNPAAKLSPRDRDLRKKFPAKVTTPILDAVERTITR